MIQKLKNLYADRVVTNLLQKFNDKNKLKVPRITKIIVKTDLSIQNAKILDSHINELSIIANQKRIIRDSKKAVSSFSLQTKPIKMPFLLVEGLGIQNAKILNSIFDLCLNELLIIVNQKSTITDSNSASQQSTITDSNSASQQSIIIDSKKAVSPFILETKPIEISVTLRDNRNIYIYKIYLFKIL